MYTRNFFIPFFIILFISTTKCGSINLSVIWYYYIILLIIYKNIVYTIYDCYFVLIYIISWYVIVIF